MREKLKRKQKEIIKNDKEDFEFMTMLNELPDVRAPRKLKKELYRELGIFYFPLHKRILSLVGLFIFTGAMYLFVQRLFHKFAGNFSLEALLKYMSLVYEKLLQFISVIKAGRHLQDVLFAFTNPWMLFGFSFVCSILILVFLGLMKERIQKETILVKLR